MKTIKLINEGFEHKWGKEIALKEAKGKSPISFAVFSLDENGEEDEYLKYFISKDKAIEWAKSQTTPTHVVIDFDEGSVSEDDLEKYGYEGYESGEIVWSSEDKITDKSKQTTNAIKEVPDQVRSQIQNDINKILNPYNLRSSVWGRNDNEFRENLIKVYINETSEEKKVGLKPREIFNKIKDAILDDLYKAGINGFFVELNITDVDPNSKYAKRTFFIEDSLQGIKITALEESKRATKNAKPLKEAKFDVKKSPLRWMREILGELNFNMPMFPDPVAGGYRFRRYFEDKEEAQETLENIKQKLAERKVRSPKAYVKDYGEGALLWVTFPRYDGYKDENGNISEAWKKAPASEEGIIGRLKYLKAELEKNNISIEIYNDTIDQIEEYIDNLFDLNDL